jgi:hypothetical protein
VGAHRYVQLGWGDFMFALGARVLIQHKTLTERACRDLISADPSRSNENTEPVCERITALGLSGAGRLRARWFLEQGAYMPHPRDGRTLNLLADLVLGVAMLERLVQREARFDDEGLAVFQGPAGHTSVLIASAQGVMSWERTAAEVARRQRALARSSRTVDAVFVGGIVGSRDQVAVPENIAGEVDNTSVAAGHSPEILSLDDIRARPELVQGLVA